MTRYLIVKVGAMGDVVMASAMLPAIRRLGPAHVTWLCGRGMAPLLRSLKGVDEIVTVDAGALLRGDRWQQLRELGAVWARLAGQRFDLCLTGHRDWRYRLLSLTARCRQRRSFGGRWGPIPGRLHDDEYARLLLGHDGFLEGHAPLAEATRLTSASPTSGAPRVLLLVGGAHNALRDDSLRRWPVGHYVRLAMELCARGIVVELIGDSQDAWVEAAFQGLPMESSIGRTTLAQLLDRLAAANVLVTHDSGPMHLQRLLRRPVVALFGPTLPDEKIAPNEQTIVLWGKGRLACCPCYDGRDYAVCDNNCCLADISPAQVLDAVLRLLERRQDKPEASQE